MAKESFQVTLTDDQLKAAKDAAARAGVNLSESGSQSRDGVTISYKVEPKESDQGASDNVITVDVLYRPFYVPLDEVQTAITNFLTNPPPPSGDTVTEAAPASAASKTQTAPTKQPEPIEHHKAGEPGKHK